MQPMLDHPVCSPALLGSCSLMEQKTDWLKGSTGEIIRRLKDREDTALDYKRWLFRWCMLLEQRSCACTDPAVGMVHAVYWSIKLTKWQPNSPADTWRGRSQLNRLRGTWEEYVNVPAYTACMWFLIVLDAGWWTRRLTRWQLISPEDTWRERIQLSRLRGTSWDEEKGRHMCCWIYNCQLNIHTRLHSPLTQIPECVIL